jgi:hypothetical protein
MSSRVSWGKSARISSSLITSPTHRAAQAHVDDVHGFVAAPLQVARELRRELVVDQESHATRITAWLVCSAA